MCRQVLAQVIHQEGDDHAHVVGGATMVGLGVHLIQQGYIITVEVVEPSIVAQVVAHTDHQLGEHE